MTRSMHAILRASNGDRHCGCARVSVLCAARSVVVAPSVLLQILTADCHNRRAHNCKQMQTRHSATTSMPHLPAWCFAISNV